MLYDSTHLRYLKQSNSEKQKVEQELPGTGQGGQWGGVVLMGTEFQICRMEKLWGSVS